MLQRRACTYRRGVFACWLVVMGCLGLVAEARAYDAERWRGSLAAPLQAAVQDTQPSARFDIDVAAGNSRIEDEQAGTSNLVTFAFLPEVYYGRLGMGLLLRFRIYTEDGKLRDEDFDDMRDYLAFLYFIQYGEESDPGGYARFGSIEDVSLGYGLFIDRYTNAVSIDDPMRGMMGAVATDHLRFEGVWSDLASPGLFGLHAAYLPFGVDTTMALPQLTFGVAVAGELNESAALVNPAIPGDPFVVGPPSADRPSTGVPLGADDGNLYMIGVDAGIRWLRTETASLLSFVEAAKMLGYGVGATVGIRGTTEVGRVRLGTQIAQRFLGKQFLPDYFGATYEAERIRHIALPTDDGEAALEAATTRRNQLAGRQRAALGFQVRLEGDYADVFESSIGYETIWEEAHSGRFHLDIEWHSPAVPVSVRLGYERFNMETLRDVLSVSEDDALYRLGLAYQVFEPLRLGVDVRQTYEPVYNQRRAVGQTKQNRVEPFVQLVWRF